MRKKLVFAIIMLSIVVLILAGIIVALELWNQKLLAPGSDNKSNQENHTKENSSAPSINESKTPGMTLPIDNTTSVLEENMDHQSETPPETKQNNDNIEDSLDETNPKSDESDETIGHNDKETEEDELPAVPI